MAAPTVENVAGKLAELGAQAKKNLRSEVGQGQ